LFIKTATGYILVDAGMPGMEQQLDEVFRLVGIEPDRVKLIVATHGHLDHIGLMSYAKRITGAKILAHRTVADRLAKGQVEPAVARNFLGQYLNLITPTDFDAVGADIAIVREFDLKPYGVRGRIIHTPGHSPGSLSIVLDNGELLIGDQVRDVGGGKIGLGMFHDNSDQLIVKSGDGYSVRASHHLPVSRKNH
jgi:glyoxylase-like metal-dependent hydrolase (beta-lactamase superfamily II)